MMEAGSPQHLGASLQPDGVNFALYSEHAEAVELCLFEPTGGESRRVFLREQDGGVWHGFLPGCTAGQHYGYRVHGPWSPADGLRFNPAKLLLDPYARQLSGAFHWSATAHDFDPSAAAGEWRLCPRDNADHMPRCVVAEPPAKPRPAVQQPSLDTVLYELNVRGFTMRHPDVPPADRGRFRGLAHPSLLRHMRALGITAVELMPVQTFIDEQHLWRLGLRNFWGYNPVHFFTTDPRLGSENDFRVLVDTLHDAGFEVILDVVYNHTGEGDTRGPVLSFRGIDNLTYYRTEPGEPGRYINDSGCGNTLNVDHPAVQELVLESLRHWRRDCAVDGFRFDLATILGRHADGFSANHPLLQKLVSDPLLAGARLIAEPWDPGAGGYQLGRFPSPWSEWNDRFRDCTRRFWRGDSGQLGELAARLHGSSDLFEPSGRGPSASINFITSHDGFTLADLGRYQQRHNQANGENNRDGQQENFSSNHGMEGDSQQPEVLSCRQQHRLNLLATLLLSQGTPMLRAGDELGQSQGGNNNAYCQDNPTSWLDWETTTEQRSLGGAISQLTALRRSLPLLRLPEYLHAPRPGFEGQGWLHLDWLQADGNALHDQDWHQGRHVLMRVTLRESSDPHSSLLDGVMLALNGEQRTLQLAEALWDSQEWRGAFSTAPASPGPGAVTDRALRSTGWPTANDSEISLQHLLPNSVTLYIVQPGRAVPGKASDTLVREA